MNSSKKKMTFIHDQQQQSQEEEEPVIPEGHTPCQKETKARKVIEEIYSTEEFYHKSISIVSQVCFQVDLG